MNRLDRRHERPGRGPVIGSTVVHVAALILAWFTTALRSEVPVFITYQIELISPEALELGETAPPEPEELVIETPEEPRPEEETPPVILEEEETLPPPPELNPIEEESEPEESEPEEPEEPTVATSPDPDPETEVTGEDINVRMEGVRRDYPDYYNNIVRQMSRCFRPPQGSTDRATIYFVISRDGTVSGIRVVESSGNFAFDLTAMGAAECAGSRNRFGPLPEELPFDRLPILFKLDPAGRGGTELTSTELRTGATCESDQGFGVDVRRMRGWG
jgi:TonB-like protein